MDKNAKKLAMEWFDSAESDRAYAEVGLKENYIFPQVGFLCQQVAEKYLKGFLIWHRLTPPRIHELPKLLDECVSIDPELEKLREACEALTAFYIDSRYPPHIPEYTKEDLHDAFQLATRIRDVIRTVIHVE